VAVFPDRIVLKNSKDGDNAVQEAIKSNGTDPIVSGEVVVSQGNGKASLYTLDANGTVVPIGVTSVDASIEPSIILNFEEDGSDTNFLENTQTTFPSAAAARWGTGGFEASNLVANSPRLDSLQIERAAMPFLGTSPWTVEFWYKADPADWDDVSGGGLPQNFQSIVTGANYWYGEGAFNIYLDAGTDDMPGGGLTTTSETSGQAFGSIVLGISPGETDSTHGDDWSQIYLPPTGEVVSSRSITVVDNNWHHIAISHEGLGSYTVYVDGELCQRKKLPEPVDYLNSGDSGQTLPVSWILGGMTYDVPDVGIGVLRGFHGMLDSFALYANLAKYKGLYGFDVPTAPNDGTPIPQTPNTLERLEDVNIPAAADIPDQAVLAFDQPSQLWEIRASLPYDITGNKLGDLGNVTLDADIDILDGEVLVWNATNDEWNSTLLEANDLTDVNYTAPVINQYLAWNGTNWGNQTIDWTHIANRPTNLGDFNNNIINSLNDIGDVSITSVSNNDIIGWNSTQNRWVNISAPPADISNSSLNELVDVDAPSPQNNYILHYSSSTGKWEGEYLQYNTILNRPTAITDLTRNVSVSYWPNDAGYINSTNADLYSIDIFGDVTIDSNTLGNGQMLIYRNGEWLNEFGPPANIAFSSIGDLSDVTYVGASAIDPGTLTVEYMGTLAFDDPRISSNLEQHVTVDKEYGLAITSFRDFDQSGTAVYADRGRGITLRSDVNYVRLTGVPTIDTNRPELRFETGDSGGDTPFGEYIGFKMPAVVDESVTYLLPGADGDVGDILATDGQGNLAWIAQAAEGYLANLQDVDVSTVAPGDGDILVYNATTGLWNTGSIAIPDIQSIDDLGDVSTKSGADFPSDGQALIWDNSRNTWVPGDVQSDEAAPAIVWNVTATDSSQYIFSGSGFTGFVGNPTLYVMRGQKYTFSKDIGAHPFQLQEIPGLGQSSYNDGVVGTVPLGVGDLQWTVPMDAPNTLYYQCTAHGAMQGTIHVLSETGQVIGSIDDLTDVDTSTSAPSNGQGLVWDGANWVPGNVAPDLNSSSIDDLGDVDTTTDAPTNGQVLVWNGTSWVPGEGGGGGGAGGALDAGRAQETVSFNSGTGEFTDLGHNGTLLDVSATADAWITFYVNSASRAADTGRAYGTDPGLSSGVVAEFFVAAGTTVLATPGTTYYNADTTQLEVLYAAVRDQSGSAVTSDVTVRAYAGKTYTAISGGTFGSG